MSTNTTMSCDWPSAKALVGDIHDDNLNVTDVVAQCANVCEVAFESKRTEILGEGIITSLFIQASLFSIFGVLLPGIIFFLNRHSRTKVAPSTLLLRKIQELLFETGIFLIVSFFVAVIFASRQAADPSIMELTYLTSLMEFQLWCIWGVTLSQSADKTLNKTEAPLRWHFGFYALFLAKFVISSYIVVPHQDLYKTLAEECHKQRQFVTAISSVTTAQDATKYTFIGLGVGVGIMVLIFLTIACIEYIPASFKRRWNMLWSCLPPWFKKSWETIFNFVMIGMFTHNIISNFYQLRGKRSLFLQTSTAGGETWGYGQTTAVLLWAPFFFSVVKETIKHMRNPPKPGTHPELKSAEDERFSEDEKYPPATDVMPPPYDLQSASVSTATTQVGANDLEAYGSRRTSSGQRA